MIETVGELIEELKRFDPNLRLKMEPGDKSVWWAPSTTEDILLPDDLHQVSADFVQISVAWFEPDTLWHPPPAL